MDFDFGLVGAPFRMQPGLRRLEPGARFLTPAAPNGRHLREKLAVLGRFPAQALCATADADVDGVLGAIAGEAARALDPIVGQAAGVLARLCGGRAGDAEPAFTVAAGKRAALDCAAPRLGWSLVDGDPRGDGDPAIGAVLAALPRGDRAAALVSLAFEEDFALLDGTTTVVPWLAVCLPSRWAPEEKVGRPFAAIHGAVADSTALVAASDALVRLVTGGERWQRFVWTISPEPRLHQHPARGRTAWPAAADADALVALASFRRERQTFLPIDGSRQAVFAIHVDSAPLTESIADADAAGRVHDAIATMSSAVLAYRGLDDARERLLDWLARRARD